MTKIIDPWGSVLVEDYAKLIKDFGLEQFSQYLELFPNPNGLMRRGAVFAGVDVKRIADAIRKKEDYYVLSGIMPSAEKIHLGTKMVIEDIRYFQDHGAETYVLVADLEAAAARGVTLEEGKKRALEFYIPAYIALGLDPSENKEVMHLAYEFAKKITANEFEAIYGSNDPGKMFSALTQVGDILYPQLKKRRPGVIPVGIDQSPHIRLTRDIVARTKTKYGFVPPSSIYNKYTPALNGKLKMSKSEPESCIELPEDAKSVCKKIKNAVTGGRDTLEEHRRLGAIIEKDMVFELLKQHLIDDDRELQKIHDNYKSGKMTSGELKQIACDKMTKFLEDFSAKLEKARQNIDKLKFVSFN